MSKKQVSCGLTYAAPKRSSGRVKSPDEPKPSLPTQVECRSVNETKDDPEQWRIADQKLRLMEYELVRLKGVLVRMAKGDEAAKEFVEKSGQIPMQVFASFCEWYCALPEHLDQARRELLALGLEFTELIYGKTGILKGD